MQCLTWYLEVCAFVFYVYQALFFEHGIFMWCVFFHVCPQVKGLVTDFGEDMHCQFLEIVRILLDSHTLSGSQVVLIIQFFFYFQKLYLVLI